MYNERELLQQVAEGSSQAFSQLFHAYRKKLYTNIFKLTDSRQMAEDIVSQVFLKIWANRHSLHTIDNFNAYLSRMAANHAYTAFRRMAKETLVLAELKKEQAGAPLEPDQQLRAKEVREFI